jgi:hypothetical protein
MLTKDALIVSALLDSLECGSREALEVCVCVREKEREREKGLTRERQPRGSRGVCVRERRRERERKDSLESGSREALEVGLCLEEHSGMYLQLLLSAKLSS